MNWIVVRKEEISYLRSRVQELEQQVAALLDRILIERGHLPIDREVRSELQEAGKEAEHLWEQVMAEETGVDRLRDEGDNADEALSTDA